MMCLNGIYVFPHIAVRLRASAAILFYVTKVSARL
ncbi:Uncharacterised protein [marine metagenome]